MPCVKIKECARVGGALAVDEVSGSWRALRLRAVSDRL